MTKKIIYWAATGLLAAMMLFSAYAYFTNPEISEGFAKMGFKDFFRVELGIAKFIGAVILLIPAVPQKVREWTFAGFGITFISAFIAHLSNGDTLGGSIAPIIALALLIVSHVFYHKLYSKTSS
ncbi:DoxX family protein [Marinoscillum pacificum]|uniref:DoxX family protein n=1 Tax=Marinoscillum pacificum TaxID=392723 RepID=UPI0021583973|nr:DoxX family protein [Marinoscillum pacificum]